MGTKFEAKSAENTVSESRPLQAKIKEDIDRIGRDADSRSDEIRALRRLPDDIANSLIDTGVFRLWVAESFGGHQSHPQVLYDAIEQMSYYEPSTGWVVMVCGTSGALSGWLDREFAQDIFSSPRAVVGGFNGPNGSAVPVEGGARVTGRWPWGSGTPHCTSIAGGVRIVDENGAPTKLSDGSSVSVMLFDREQVALLDNWRTTGLQGTASGDYEVTDAFVPEGRWLNAGQVFVDDPLYQFPRAGLLGVGVAHCFLGMAKRALDEILPIAVDKIPVGSSTRLAEKPLVQTWIAEAEARYRASRAFLREAVQNAYEDASSGEASLESKRLLRLAASHATSECTTAVDTIYRIAGGSSIWEDSQLSKIFRDVHVGSQHGVVGPLSFEPMGKLALGLKVPPGGI